MGVLIKSVSGGTTDVQRNGFTWTLAGAPTIVTAINGDKCVVGACTVNSVTPAWDGTTSGSMKNPVPATAQGYDTRAVQAFSAGVRVSFPVALSPGDSLISTLGQASPSGGGANDVLDKAAVLSCITADPGEPFFRPAYVPGAAGKVILKASDINYGLLPSLTNLGGAGAMMTLAQIAGGPYPAAFNLTGGLWINHGGIDEKHSCMHPKSDMPPYGRETNMTISMMAVKACVNHSEQVAAANWLIQFGIDQDAIHLTNGDSWKAAGGFAYGFKWPIIFKRIMAEEADLTPTMTAVSSVNGATIPKFAEDGHNTATYLWGAPCDLEGYSSPWFGNHDCRDPGKALFPEAMTNGGLYRECCTERTSVGMSIAISAFDAWASWGNDTFKDYMDDWVVTPAWWQDSGGAYLNDLYGYGGDGNGMMNALYTAYWVNGV